MWSQFLPKTALIFKFWIFDGCWKKVMVDLQVFLSPQGKNSVVLFSILSRRASISLTSSLVVVNTISFMELTEFPSGMFEIRISLLGIAELVPRRAVV